MLAAALGGHFAKKLDVVDNLQDVGDAPVEGALEGPELCVTALRRGGAGEGRKGELREGGRSGEKGIMVQGKQLNTAVNGLGGYLGIAKTTWITVYDQFLRSPGCPGAKKQGEQLPGMMYVSDRSVDSICDTWWEFLVIKSSYIWSHWGGSEKARFTPELPGAAARSCLSDGLDIAFGDYKRRGMCENESSESDEKRRRSQSGSLYQGYRVSRSRAFAKFARVMEC